MSERKVNGYVREGRLEELGPASLVSSGKDQRVSTVKRGRSKESATERVYRGDQKETGFWFDMSDRLRLAVVSRIIRVG